MPRRKKNFRPFEDARQFVIAAGIGCFSDWNLYCKGDLPGYPAKPDDIPAAPPQVYLDEWQGWTHWFGRTPRTFQSYAAAKRFVHGLKLQTQKEWNLYCKGEMPDRPPLPDDIPRRPFHRYRDDGWRDWGDWLGNGKPAVASEFVTYSRAREIVMQEGIRNVRQFRRYIKGTLPGHRSRPPSLPAAPDQFYKGKGWTSWYDFLGKAAPADKYVSYAEAKRYAEANRIGSEKEWRDHHDALKPGNRIQLPRCPDKTYRDRGWKGWMKFLAREKKRRGKERYRSFREARKFARSLELTGSRQWQEFCAGRMPEKGERPLDIPAHPCVIYRGRGWRCWGDWLGSCQLK